MTFLPRLALIFVLLGSLPLLAQDILPMSKGTTWVYSARVKWSAQGKQPGGTKTLRWAATVADSYRKGHVEAALLHGGPWDLAWYSPTTTAKDSLVVRDGATYYLVRENARDAFDRLKELTSADIEKEFAGDIWFRVPLQVSDDFCAPDQEKTAPFYCWSVEKVTTTHSLKVPGFGRRSATEYFLAFLTNPDTTTLTLVPGAGIVTYYYEHHGTVAEASVKLVEFHPPGVSARRVAPRRRASKVSKVK
jgi:hypothetical protein